MPLAPRAGWLLELEEFPVEALLAVLGEGEVVAGWEEVAGAAGPLTGVPDTDDEPVLSLVASELDAVCFTRCTVGALRCR